MHKIHGYVFYNKENNTYLGKDMGSGGYPFTAAWLHQAYIVPYDNRALEEARRWIKVFDGKYGTSGYILRSIVLEVI